MRGSRCAVRRLSFGYRLKPGGWDVLTFFFVLSVGVYVSILANVPRMRRAGLRVGLDRTSVLIVGVGFVLAFFATGVVYLTR